MTGFFFPVLAVTELFLMGLVHFALTKLNVKSCSEKGFEEEEQLKGQTKHNGGQVKGTLASPSSSTSMSPMMASRLAASDSLVGLAQAREEKWRDTVEVEETKQVQMPQDPAALKALEKQKARELREQKAKRRQLRRVEYVRERALNNKILTAFHFSNYFQALISIYLFSYNGLCNSIFNAFHCITLANGTRVLNNFPAVDCDSNVRLEF
jgi:hypothetical protein